jgi:hypothetical protein
MAPQPGPTQINTEEQELFLLSNQPIRLTPVFFGRYREQVPMGQRWLIYKDGEMVDQLNPGRHTWWGGFGHTWERQAVDTRIKSTEPPLKIKGMVKGPAVQDAQGASNTNLACKVEASLTFSLKLKDVETFMQRSRPFSDFQSAVHDLVVEFIGLLPYDQNGSWAKTLREQIRGALQGGRWNVELQVGLSVVDVFVGDLVPDSSHDRQVLAMYQLIEHGKRELIEAVDNRKRDVVTAQSFAEQGALLNIAPSILKLQDSPIGKALIEQDSKLRELIIATGLNPGINIQPLQENPYQISGSQSAPNVYLNPPSSNFAQIAPPSNPLPQQSGPVSGQLSPYITGSLATTGNLGRQNPTMPFPSGPQPAAPFSGAQQPGMPYPGGPQPAAPFSGAQQPGMPYPGGPQPGMPFSGSSDTLAVDETRQTLELSALEKAGFNAAGRGQINTATNEWTLMVYKRRPNGILTIAFICPAGYPNTAPRVQMKTSAGSGYTPIEPNSTQGWQAHRLLADVAQEILETTV